MTKFRKALNILSLQLLVGTILGGTEGLYVSAHPFGIMVGGINGLVVALFLLPVGYVFLKNANPNRAFLILIVVNVPILLASLYIMGTLVIPMAITILAYVVTLVVIGAISLDEESDANCCTRCGYNLTGNVSGICPECGRKIELAQDRP